MKLDLSSVYLQALAAAKDAEKKYIDEHGEPYFCGFAWVVFPSARTKWVNWCKQYNIGSRRHPKGWYIWDVTNSNTQSMAIKEVAARAFAEVMQSHGIECTVGSRAD